MAIRRAVRVALLAGVAAASLATPANGMAASAVEDVVEAWGEDPVYVDDSRREVLSESEERRLEDRIDGGERSVYIAVLPEDARDASGGTTTGLLRELAREQGADATYAAIVGDEFRAGSTSGVPASRLSQEAFAARRGDGAAAVLDDFVQRVQGAGSSGAGGAGADRGGGGGLGVLLLPLLLVGGAFMLLRRRGRRGAGGGQALERDVSLDDIESDELTEVTRAARGDLVALGEDLHAMDIEIQLPDAPELAKQRHVGALDSYQKVSAAIDSADTLQELRPLSGEIARGRYALDCARALLDGKPEPAPRVPCFFDPRHGTSTRDVQWIGPQDQPLTVPACEICADRVDAGRQPDTRQVQVQGRDVPYYEAPQMGGYYGGFFGGGGGGGSLLSGILLGNMLGGGGLFGGGGWGSGGGWSSGDGGGGFGGGGDFGGDFGGGGDF